MKKEMRRRCLKKCRLAIGTAQKRPPVAIKSMRYKTTLQDTTVKIGFSSISSTIVFGHSLILFNFSKANLSSNYSTANLAMAKNTEMRTVHETDEGEENRGSRLRARNSRVSCAKISLRRELVYCFIPFYYFALVYFIIALDPLRACQTTELIFWAQTIEFACPTFKLECQFHNDDFWTTLMCFLFVCFSLLLLVSCDSSCQSTRISCSAT